MRRVDHVLVSTCPPMAPIAGVVMSWFRRIRLTFWEMDLNPDQIVALGIVGERSWTARAFNLLNRLILARADDVVVLDRFMADRVSAKRDVRHKMTILPPWPHEDHLEPVSRNTNPFRAQHKLEGKCVVMYSGNHTLSNPITTILDAAVRLREDSRLVFMFIGGGAGKKEVEATRSPNIISLPYQPLDQLKYSLSAADVHRHDRRRRGGHRTPMQGLWGDGGRTAGAAVGPEPCHVSDLLSAHDWGWHVKHGDVDRAENILREIVDRSTATLDEKGSVRVR